MNAALQLAIVIGLFLALAAWWRRLDDPSKPPGIFWRFWANTARVFAGWNTAYFLAAGALTWWMVAGGTDRSLQDWWQTANPIDRSVAWFVLIAGNFWTLVAALAIYVVGRLRRNRDVRLSGAAALQAILSAFLITQTLKLLTGRRGPLDPADPHLAPFPKVESASDFSLEFWNHTFLDGRFFWPSGHTLTSMVLVTTLLALHPQKRWMAWIGYPIVLAMGVIMVDGDFHWTSDVLAALLIGAPIGWVIGRRFRQEDGRRSSQSSSLGE